MRTDPKHLAVLFAVVVFLAAAPLAADQAIDAVAAFEPDAFHLLAGPVELAVPADAPTPLIEAVVDSRVGDGIAAAGTRLFAGAFVAEGALINHGGGTLVVRQPDGTRTLVEPGHGVVVRPAAAAAADADPCSVCSVSCSDGYYACCKRRGWFSCAKCTCVANGEEGDCDSGGPGSRSCSVGAASASPQAALRLNAH